MSRRVGRSSSRIVLTCRRRIRNRGVGCCRTITWLSWNCEPMTAEPHPRALAVFLSGRS
jgi:hypothetical protein